MPTYRKASGYVSRTYTTKQGRRVTWKFEREPRSLGAAGVLLATWGGAGALWAVSWAINQLYLASLA